MTTTPDPPPEARLIEAKRKGFRPVLSVRKAAQLADLSEGRWRQIALGYSAAAAGVKVPVRAPAETLARMALTVNASARELAESGRPDAAAELEFLLTTKHDPVRPGSDVPLSEAARDAGLSVVSDEELLSELQRRLADRWRARPEESDHRGNTSPIATAGVESAPEDDDTYGGVVPAPARSFGLAADSRGGYMTAEERRRAQDEAAEVSQDQTAED